MIGRIRPSALLRRSPAIDGAVVVEHNRCLVASQATNSRRAGAHGRFPPCRALATLRSTASDRVVRSRTVYVARGDNGCMGTPTLQIPAAATAGDAAGLQPGLPRDFVPPSVDGRPAKVPQPEIRWTALRVTEPVWFEGGPALPVGSWGRVPPTLEGSKGAARRQGLLCAHGLVREERRAYSAQCPPTR